MQHSPPVSNDFQVVTKNQYWGCGIYETNQTAHCWSTTNHGAHQWPAYMPLADESHLKFVFAVGYHVNVYLLDVDGCIHYYKLASSLQKLESPALGCNYTWISDSDCAVNSNGHITCWVLLMTIHKMDIIL